MSEQTKAEKPVRRKAVRDPEGTRARILAAAREEFALHGLSGARVDRIAERADTNKRMLYYYVGNKESLFLVVLEAAYADIRAAERKLSLELLAPDEAIAKLIDFTWHYFIEHPEFLTLLNNENLHQARHLAQSQQIQSMNSPLIRMLETVLTRGVAEGVFRPGVDPVQLYISIAGLAYFYLGNLHTLAVIFGRDLMTREARAARLSHMIELVLESLKA